MSMQAVFILALIISAVIGYLLGGVSWAIILTRIVQRKDIREQGSGNAGMTNVLRSVGKLPALLTFAGDFVKCVIAVLLSQLALYLLAMAFTDIAPGAELFRYTRYIAGTACVVGHIFPIYYGFRGGKGIVTAAAMILLTDWRVFIAVILTFGLVFAWKKIMSLCSVTSAGMYPVCTFLIVFFMDYSRGFCGLEYLLFATGVSLFVGVLVLVKHRANIGRLMRGEEKPIIGTRSR